MRRILGLPADDPAGAARFLFDQGFDSLVVGIETPLETVQAAVDNGLQVWAHRAAFSVRGIPESEVESLLVQDVDGAPRRWFGSGCPNQPRLRQNHLAAIERLARSGLYAGFMLDGIRFASPNSGDSFYTCFCPLCRAKATTLGFDFDRIHQDVTALRDWSRTATSPFADRAEALPDALGNRWPGVDAWLRFRAASVIEHVAEIRHAIDSWKTETGHPFQLGAYLFTPAFAPLVGQRYGQFAPLLDLISPMIYRINTNGDSALESEWSHLATLNLFPPHGEFTVEDLAAQVAHAHTLLSATETPLVPIIRLDDDRIAASTRATLASGAAGVDYFIFRAGDEPFVRTAASSW